MLEKSMMMVQFNEKYLLKFLKDGTLTKEDLFKFYTGEDMGEKYKLIEKEIEENYAWEMRKKGIKFIIESKYD